MSEQERIRIPLEQLPEHIKVELLLPRDVYKVLLEVAVNHQPQMSVVEVIQMWLENDTEELRRRA